MRYGNTRIVDITRIQNELQWEAKFADGIQVIKDSIKWLEDNDFIDYEAKKVRLLRRWEDHFVRKKD